jgi:hypothetical protein
MIDRCHVAAPEARKADGAPVERDRRGTVDREPQAAAVERADRKARGSHPYDDAAIDALRRCRTDWHEDNSGTQKHQPKPSHVRMLAKAGQRDVSCV